MTIGPLRVQPYPSTSTRVDHVPLRIFVSPILCTKHKLSAGDTLVLIPALTNDDLQQRLSLEQAQSKKPDRRFALGIAWPTATLEAHSIAAPPALLQGIAESGDLVLISPINKSGLAVSKATEILVAVSDGSSDGHTSEDLSESSLLTYIQQRLRDNGYIKAAQEFKLPYVDRHITVACHAKGSKRAEVYNIEPDTIISFSPRVKVKASSAQVNGTTTAAPASYYTSERQLATYAAIGGLDTQIEQIREMVELPLTRPDLYAHFGLTLPRGLLLYGPPGTGKTLLASAVASSLGIPLFIIDGPSLSSPFHGETEERLRNVFSEASKSSQGGIIVIDEVDALAPKREDAGEVEKRVVATLLTLMDGIGDKTADEITKGHVMVIAATNRPNALDPALRRPGRFDREIEIGVPNADARLSILNVLLRNTPHDLSEAALKDVSDRAHGFVGADLSSLLRTACVNGIRRSLTQQTPIAQMRLSLDDLEAALVVTRPSAMREVLIETPHTSWSDIGGLVDVKRRLQETVQWPLQHPQTFKRLGVRPPTGVLLYGPPGCSKTLVARALATEAKLNFITIKGPEVFNKYVGESERTIRETFKKARLAAPSIIFIDEIDAIASGRDSEDSSPTSNRVLTTLLTEMDGIEELVGVTVLAATNRPFAIDSALLRPGRLDHLLYLAPPDLDARTAIFQIHLSRMSVEAGLVASELAEITQGRSGAEIASICQNAALQAMQHDRDALCIKREHFLSAAAAVRRRISPEMLADYEAWRDEGGAI